MLTWMVRRRCWSNITFLWHMRILMMIFMMMYLMRIWHWRRCRSEMVIMMMVLMMVLMMVHMIVLMMLVYMMFLMMEFLMSPIVMMGWRRSNQSSWLPMVRASMGLSLEDIRGKRSAIAHSIAVSEVSMVPFLLETLFQISRYIT